MCWEEQLCQRRSSLVGCSSGWKISLCHTGSVHPNLTENKQANNFLLLVYLSFYLSTDVLYTGPTYNEQM